MRHSTCALLCCLLSIQSLTVYLSAFAQEASGSGTSLPAGLADPDSLNSALLESDTGLFSDGESPPQTLLQAGSCAALADEILRKDYNCRSIKPPTNGYPLEPGGGSCGDCYWGFVALVKACGLPVTQQTCNDNLASFCGIPAAVTTPCHGWRLSNPPVAECWCNAWPH